MRPTRILIAAENASTHFGGEAILPFHYFRLLRDRGLDAHLITHARTRNELLSAFPSDQDHLHFVEDRLLQKLLYRLGRMFPARLSEASFGLLNQMLTQAAQRGILRDLVIPGAVIHQPIPVSPRFPSLLFDLGAPVAIGPLNGGMEFPPAFRKTESWLSRLLIQLARNLSNRGNALFPGKRRAAVILVANQRTRRALPSGLDGSIVELVENAVDLSQWTSSPLLAPRNHFVFIGRLVDWKALHLVIEALAQVPEAHLDVIGDGPMRSKWQQAAEVHRSAERVHFHGWLPQSECARFLAGSCALVLPSLYECGGAVVLEAMAMSRPVIATAWGGPVDYLDASCGILIPPANQAALVLGFADAMRTLLDSPNLAKQMGLAGADRLRRTFDWQQKIDRILEVYSSLN